MNTNYKPAPGSLAEQVVGFFHYNPSEELTIDDIAQKFDCVRGNTHTKLRPAIDAGLLKRSVNNDGEYVYVAGKAFASGMPAEPAEAVAAAPAVKRKTIVRVTHAIDFDKLKVDENMPMPARACKGAGKWDPLFAMLKKPKQSIDLPNTVRTAVTAEINKRHKQGSARYRIVKLSPTTARIARLADEVTAA